MATQNLAGVDALLKNVYRGPWVEQLNQETIILDIVEKTDANQMGTFNGRQLIFPVHSSRNHGRGAVTDGGQLATAGTQGTVDAIVTMKYFNVGIEISDQAIKQSKSDEGSFVRVLTFEMDLAHTDIRKDITRVAYGTGDGVLANYVSGGGTGPSVTLTVDSGQYIAVGDVVDILVKSTGVSHGTGGTVTAVSMTGTANSSTQAQASISVTFPSSVTAQAAGDAVYVTGDRVNESDGLRNITSTGRTLHSINSSSNPFWDSNVLSFGNANPSEDGIMHLCQQIRQRSGKTPDVVVFTLGGQRRLANTYASQKRWNDDHVGNVEGGYEAIMVAAGGKPIPVIADPDCPNGTGFALNKESFCWSQIGPPDWLEAPVGGGSILYLKDGSALGTKARIWQGWMCWDAVLATVAPNRNGQFTNINDDQPVVRI